jgi:hypothetical protein
MIDPRRVFPALLLLGLPVLGGCGPRVTPPDPHHVGAKVNLANFIKNPAAYKGKAIMLPLRVDEPIVPARGQSLRDYVGRDARFTTRGPRGERLDVAIHIPEGLPVPEAGNAAEVFVTFVCTRGSLRQGNEARAIQLR